MRTLKVLSLAGAALAASIGFATAADLPYKAPPPEVPLSNWSGWYVGLNGSWLRGDTDWAYPAVAGAVTSPGFSQAFVGVHAGMNFQFPGLAGFVLSTESSFNAATGNFNGDDGALCPNPAFSCQSRIGKYFTTGGRLGYAWNQFMLYASGGFAAGEVNTRGVALAGGAIIENTSAWHTGFYFGGGFDFEVYKTAGTSMILGLEYQHLDLGTAFHNVGGVPGGLSREVDVTSDLIKAKLTVKLDGPYWFR